MKNKIFLLALCIMGNHAHILTKAGDIEKVSLFMKAGEIIDFSCNNFKISIKYYSKLR